MAAMFHHQVGGGISNSNAFFSGTGISLSGSQSFQARDVHINSERNQDSALLADLAVTDPRSDKTRIERIKGGLQAECCQWILQHADFQQWRNGTRIRQLWIKGDPGKGKTMLACAIINELESSYKDTHNIAYFFCQATNTTLNSATAALRGLLYILVVQQRHLLAHLRDRYETRGKKMFEDIDAWDTLCTMLHEMLRDPALRETFVIVDALDECDGGLAELLTLIGQISSYDRVKVLVTSRNWPSIERGLNLGPPKTHLSLEMNHESISAAVKIYIDVKVDELYHKIGFNDEIRRDAFDYLMNNSNNTFLWVALVCRELMNTVDIEDWEIGPLLRQFPPRLAPLYKRMMEQLFYSRHFELCRRVIASVCSAYRPISLAELENLIEAPDQVRGRIEVIVGHCHSFLTLRDRFVYFVHQSAKEFLLRKEPSRIIPSGIDHQHQVLFLKSLDVLNRTLKRNIYGLRSAGTLASQVEKPRDDPLEPTYYSCVFWLDHLSRAGPWKVTSLQDGGTVHEFLKNKLLYWLEALSLMKKLSAGILAIRHLTELTAQGSGKAVFEMARDALRFILSHKVGIELAPLQVYSSAMIFSPTGSLVRQKFESQECSKWITPKPAMNEKWSPCLQTLEGHTNEVIFVFFLPPNDAQLVSFSFDGTIKTWDLSTGACLRTLNRYREDILSMAALPDGSALVSGSVHPEVKVWDWASGECLEKFRLLRMAIRSVAVSPDGTLFASGSQDETISIYRITTGECLHIMTLSDPVRCVAFSHDGTQLASGSMGHGIQIWDVATGALLRTISKCREVVSVGFAPDGKWLASVSLSMRPLETGLYGTAQIWDAASHECLYEFEERTEFQSLAISPDGQRVAFLLDDGQIRIWYDKRLRTLARRGRRTVSMTFSSDSAWLALGLEDGSIQLWDAGGDTWELGVDYYSSSIHLIVMSSDGSRIATVSRNNTIKVWDAATSACLFTLTDRWYDCLTLSPDGSKLALSYRRDGAIKVYSTLTNFWFEKGISKEDMDRAEFLAFAPHGGQLASVLGSATLKIWDTITRDQSPPSCECLHTVEVRDTSDISLLAYSRDSSRLVAGGLQPVIKIWDTSNWALLHTIHRDPSCVSSLDSSNRMQLHTPFGYFDLQRHMHEKWLNRFPIDSQEDSVLGISRDGGWITKYHKPVLWLSPEYRPSCMDLRGMTIGIGCSMEGFLCFQFSLQSLGLETS